jgi:myo-inositol-1(or 4)-monophosphatase
VSSVSEVSDSLLATGFPYNVRENLDPIISRFKKCLNASQGIRRNGSAALDLCHVASGRFEGFWEENLKPWDTAAGVLIAEEAGAQVTDFSGHPYSIKGKETLVTNGRIHADMVSLLKLP